MMGRTPPTDYTTFALVAVSGFALGLMVGLLFAPSSGYETRHMIGDRASSAYESAREMAKRRAEELGERVEEIA
jgi:gas vesicle protein